MVNYYAKVRFNGSYRDYEYLTVLSNLKYDDDVLLDSSNGLGLGKFAGYTENNPTISHYSWILAKVEVDFLRNKIKEKM